MSEQSEQAGPAGPAVGRGQLKPTLSGFILCVFLEICSAQLWQ